MEESLGARLLKQIKEVGELAGIKTEEYAKISKKRIDVLSLDREVNKEKAALGERVYELAQREGPPDVLGDVTIQALIERIRKLNLQLAECEQEIDVLRQGAASRTADVRRRYREEGEGGAPTPPPQEGRGGI